MAEAARVICDSAELVDGGRGVRFAVDHGGRLEPAFVVRYGGKVYGYLNMCAHRPLELDYPEGEFFDQSGVYSVRSVHGATYQPDTGRCVMGPCSYDDRLIPLQVEERDGEVYLMSNGSGNV
jgi:nitrite reductase/ring-hydroxylating ferredoxin subunit